MSKNVRQKHLTDKILFGLTKNIYTGQQKKGYKVICLLFYKTE